MFKFYLKIQKIKGIIKKINLIKMEEQFVLENTEAMIAKSFKAKGEMRSLYHAIFEKLFEQKKLDPRECIIFGINNAKDKNDLAFLYICLNSTKRPNFYVNTDNGEMHILAYGFKVLNDDLLPVFVFIMILKGVDPLLPVFNTKSEIQSETVVKWIFAYKRQRIPETQSMCMEKIESLKEDDRLIIDVAFDLLDSYSIEYLSAILVFRKPIFQKIEKIDIDKLLVKAYHSAFKEFFIQILDSGILPTYLNVCYFVSHFVRIHRMTDVQYVSEDLRNMLREVVKRGVKIDQYITSEISTEDPVLGLTLKEQYERPLWEKISHVKTDGFVPKKLKTFSQFFGFEGNEDKEIMCQFFREIATSDEDTIVRNFSERNQILQSIKLTPGIGKIQNKLSIENGDNFERMPFEYPEIMVGFCREGNEKFAFLAPSFDLLIRTKTNSFSRRHLQRHFIQELTNKLQFLRENEIDPSTIKPVRELIHELKNPDVLNNQESDQIMDDISRKLNAKGYTKDAILDARRDLIEKKLSFSFKDYFSLSDRIEKPNQMFLSLNFIYLVILRVLYEKNENMERISIF